MKEELQFSEIKERVMKNTEYFRKALEEGRLEEAEKFLTEVASNLRLEKNRRFFESQF